MDIQKYLIDTPSEVMKDSLKAWSSLEIIGGVWRLLDAYDYYVCGHVQNCFYNGIS